MILTREKSVAGYSSGFRSGMSMVVVTLAVLVLAAPAWSQEEKPVAPAATATAAQVAQDADKSLLWMPEAISTYGEGVDWLFWLIFWITGIAFVVVEGLMLYFLIIYRHREGREKAHYTHGNNKLEVVWTLATIAILVFIGVIQLWGASGWLTIKTAYPEMGQGKEGEETFVIRVYGEQFAWYFNYPGKDGQFGDQRHSYIDKASSNPVGLVKEGVGADDKVLPRLIVPEGVNVLIQLISLGKYNLNTDPPSYTHPVLHSFFSPHLRLKQDLVPYHPGQIWFRVKVGNAGEKFEIVCAELCGEGHSGMRADFLVLDEAGLAKELGYDWRTAVPAEFPEVVHYYQEEKEEE